MLQKPIPDPIPKEIQDWLNNQHSDQYLILHKIGDKISIAESNYLAMHEDDMQLNYTLKDVKYQ